jgi:hypothetical protein
LLLAEKERLSGFHSGQKVRGRQKNGRPLVALFEDGRLPESGIGNGNGFYPFSGIASDSLSGSEMEA